MGYALSEDVVNAVNFALFKPFPYREDVATGMYVFEAAKQGLVKLTPVQRKDHMPLNFTEHCTNQKYFSDDKMKQVQVDIDYLILHRYGVDNTECLWNVILNRRRAADFPKFEEQLQVTNNFGFCSCY